MHNKIIILVGGCLACKSCNYGRKIGNKPAIMQITLNGVMLSKFAKSTHEQINAYSDDVSMLIASSQDQDLS